MFAARPRSRNRSILLSNLSAIFSADGSLQSEVMAFHSTVVKPSSRAMRNTAGLRAPNGAVRRPVLDGDAVDELATDGAVADFERRPLWAR